ncbi:MAG: UDP-N-acetylglucosamine 2-epimerase [Candidatus Eremiobacteraeota bacterium]|nr:UDP-N-acetylglucosamine 2-epimerase [Candidatus Eremiobacteraeota bacterium]
MKRICVFTGSRAEYGILKPLIDKINEHSDLSLSLLVSGMHLSPEFGLTYRDIERDGVVINEKVEMLLSSDSPVGITKAIGLGMISYCEAIQRLCPDILLVLGDRFEAFSFATAGYVSRVPIAHLHGGEATFGLIDEGFRHCITKMSHLHFTSTETYRQKVIQMGECPESVFCVGALGIDAIRAMKFMAKDELEKDLEIRFKEHNLLVTFHPVTLEHDSSEKHFKTLLEALMMLQDTMILFTKTNADNDGRIINKMIDEFAASNPSVSAAFSSLGQHRYMSLMKYVDAVVGNSSSGIIEAPSFNIGTVNIGDRQLGRVKAESIIDCEPSLEGISKAFLKLYSEDFIRAVAEVTNPYDSGGAVLKIVEALANCDLGKLGMKRFYDVIFNVKKKEGQ